MNTPRTALHGQNTTITGCLYMAFELGEKSWKLSLGDGMHGPSRHTLVLCSVLDGTYMSQASLLLYCDTH